MWGRRPAPMNATRSPWAICGRGSPARCRGSTCTAAEPERLDESGAAPALRRLQYSLHLAAEHVYGLEPPPAAASAHAELADALVCARDATADVAEAVSIWGGEGVDTLLHEWRGALFRVRLARMRLAAPAPRAVVVEEPFKRDFGWPLAAFMLALIGALAFVGRGDASAVAALGHGPRRGVRLGRRLPPVEHALRRPRQRRAGRGSPRGRAARCSRTARVRPSTR